MAKYLSLFLLFVCASVNCSDARSCQGRCGQGYYKGSLCQCDYECLGLNECCSDFESLCTTKNSCKGRCGEPFNRGNPCHCDFECTTFNQCCSDYESLCLVEELKPRSIATPARRISHSCLNITTKKHAESSNEDMSDYEDKDPPAETTPSAVEGSTITITTVGLPSTTSPGGSTITISLEVPTNTTLSDGPPNTTLSDRPTTVILSEGSTSTITTEESTSTISSECPTTTISSEGTTTIISTEDSTSTITTEGSTTITSEGTTLTKDSTTTVPTEDPTSTVTTEEPTTILTTESPTSTVPTESLTTTITTEEPTTILTKESPTSTVPTESPTRTVPTESPTRTVPTESPTTTVPTEEPTTFLETESPTTTVPTEEPTTFLKTESPTTTVPTEEPTTFLKTESPTTTVLTEEPTTFLKTESPTTTVPTEEPTTILTTESPTSTEPTEEPTTTVTTEMPTSTVPTKSTTSTEPTEGPTTLQINPTQDNLYPQDPGPGSVSIPPTQKPTKPTSVKNDKIETDKDYQADDYDTNLCSGRPVSGLTTLKNGTIVAFRGHYFWTLDKERNPAPARLITNVWGIPSPIDTVFTRCNCEGKTYFFKGNNYWRFEDGSMDPGFPKHISQGFGRINHITAALSIPQYRSRHESVIFFRRGGLAQKYTYQVTPSCGSKPRIPLFTVRNRFRRDTVSSLGRVIKISSNWKGFPTTVTSAVSVPSRVKEGYKYYVFSQKNYYGMKMERERPVVLKAINGQRENAANSFFKCPQSNKV